MEGKALTLDKDLSAKYRHISSNLQTVQEGFTQAMNEFMAKRSELVLEQNKLFADISVKLGVTAVDLKKEMLSLHVVETECGDVVATVIKKKPAEPVPVK